MSFIDRLIQFTSECRPDMHEPDEQGISARVVGYTLDNACGEDISERAIVGGYQEIVVILSNGSKEERFNLSSLIAMARFGADNATAQKIFGDD